MSGEAAPHRLGGAFCGALEAYKFSDQRVVPRMGRVGIIIREKLVQSVLRIADTRRRNLDSDLPESGSADEHQKSGDCLPTFMEIAKAVEKGFKHRASIGGVA